MRLQLLEPPSARPERLDERFDTGPRSIAAVRVLRISITDRCNFRCVYCMPEEGVRWLPQEDILTLKKSAKSSGPPIEIHGIRRFKLTGGEPTVRHGLVDLVAHAAADSTESKTCPSPPTACCWRTWPTRCAKPGWIA